MLLRMQEVLEREGLLLGREQRIADKCRRKARKLL
jgi:hypothetical protein